MFFVKTNVTEAERLCLKYLREKSEMFLLGITMILGSAHSTVTDLARFFGLSMSQPFSFAA